MPITDVTINTDDQKQLVDSLVALRTQFTTGVGTVTKADVTAWYNSIGTINSWAKFTTYERKFVLLFIECMLAILRRVNS